MTLPRSALVWWYVGLTTTALAVVCGGRFCVGLVSIQAAALSIAKAEWELVTTTSETRAGLIPALRHEMHVVS